MSLLVVDDELDIRTTFKEVLAAVLPYEVDVAADAAEALRVVRAKPVALVLTDERMPDMTGSELVRQLRAEGYGGPCVVMSAYGAEGDVAQKAKRAGAQQFLPKPVSLSTLVKTIETYVKPDR